MRFGLLIAALPLLVACERSEPAAANNAAAASETAAIEAEADRPATFDCARADGQAQQLVCSDPELAAIDRESARLASLVPTVPEPLDSLASTRDACGKSDDLRQCVLDAYASAIHALRRDQADARAADGTGVTLGPVHYSCGNEKEPLAATFINTDPGAVHLEWNTTEATLAHVPSGSGVKYSGRVDGKAQVFWTKGREATLGPDGSDEDALRCVQDDSD